uniref:Leishmanolysin-like peptidase n=1 Tax=Ciona savignyi TaxID=51511 RepID=H2YII4_CIOSA
MFHVLGFSQKLFNKFQNCQVEIRNSVAHYACEDRSNVFGYVREWYRILTPSVSWVAQNHFNCSYIKGPLEANSEMKRVSSHWESRYIQPSLMTSSIGLPHLTVLDRITLAVFQDTGWYKVNMSEADELFWGKNAGCEFGTTTSCRSGNSPFFCTTSEAVNGCHYLHLDKGICETNDFLDSCKVYQASKGSECWVDPYN